MMRWILGLVVALALVRPATAEPKTLRLDGVIGNIWSVGFPLPAGDIALGDSFRLDLSYDPDAYDPASFGAAMTYQISMPHYHRSGLDQVTILAMNDHQFCAQCEVFDRLTFASSPLEDDGGPHPFDVGDGTYYEHFDVTLYDDTATALDSEVASLPFPISKFSTRYINFVFYDPYAVKIVFAQGSVTAMQEFGTGVPEPTSWALIISGLGMVGARMRLRRPASRAS